MALAETWGDLITTLLSVGASFKFLTTNGSHVHFHSQDPSDVKKTIVLALWAIWLNEARATMGALVYATFSDIKLLYITDAEKIVDRKGQIFIYRFPWMPGQAQK